MGDRIPADHGYRLYSAIVALAPALKDCHWQLLTIPGIPDYAGWIQLGNRSTLGVRCSLDDLGHFDPLNNAVLKIGKSLIQLGALTGCSLQPCEALAARVVTIKTNYHELNAFEFGVALGKQLAQANIKPMPKLGKRCTLRVRDAIVVGYGVSFEGLTPEESIRLQQSGLGGRRRLGCGVFLPSTSLHPSNESAIDLTAQRNRQPAIVYPTAIEP